MKSSLLSTTFLVLVAWGSCYEERDFPCAHSDAYIESTSVCDGVVDCANKTGASISYDSSDEDNQICAQVPHLEYEISLTTALVTNSSVELQWSPLLFEVSPVQKEELAGFFLTGKSQMHSFQNTASRDSRDFEVQGLRPWTSYTFILRPFYTASGKPETLYKLGKAAVVQARTLPAVPQPPKQLSLLSTKQRNVVLNIVEPSAWNSDPQDYYIEWKASGVRMESHRGPRGHITVPLEKANSSRDNNALNVTLPLPGGWLYVLHISARGRSISGAPLASLKMEFWVTVNVDLYEISASPIGPHQAFVSWRTAKEFEFYRVTVYTDLGEGLQVYSQQSFDQTWNKPEWHSVVIENLHSWRFHVVSLEGCEASGCEVAINTTFVTPPRVFPAPSMADAERTGSLSFEASWKFATNDLRIFAGFVVRACFKGRKECLLRHTEDTRIHISGLPYFGELEVEIRAKFEFVDGISQLGPPTTVKVPDLAIHPTLTLTHKATIYDGLGTSVIAWKSDSEISYLQYRLPGISEWLECKSTEECDATTHYRNSTLRTRGYMRITHYRRGLGTISINVRGCNFFGCGYEHSVSLSTHIPGSASPFGASVSIEKTTALVQWGTPSFAGPRGALITWHCPGIDTFQYLKIKERGIFDSDCCRHTHLRELTEPEKCVFQVALYQYVGGIMYYGEAVEALVK